MTVFKKICLITCMICVGTILLYQKYGENITQVTGNLLENKQGMSNADADAKDIIIVIDAGHGGFDPGKVGINGELEKNVNLNISRCLAGLLQDSGMTVVMTRDEDLALCKEDAASKKGEDLRNRVDIINNSGAALAVSIHQNSFTGSSAKGGQVFYHADSKEGRLLSHYIQDSIRGIDENNDRVEKDNKTYYILRKSSIPAVIVECGFLSNEEEAAKLCDAGYQMLLAQKICEGIITYLNSEVLNDEYNSEEN